MKIWQMRGFVRVRFTVTATLLRCQHVHVLCCQESKTRWLQEASPCTWTNCLMKENVFLAVCVGVSLCGSHLRKWVTKSNRQTVVLPLSRNPMYKCVSHCVLAQFHSSLHLNATGLCPDFSRHSSYTTYCFVLPTLIIQVEDQNKGRGYCGCVCACVCSCVCVCALRVGGGCVKEEVLSGTEAFCRCCREEGLNGKFCGYQSYSSTLWLEKACRMWPHPNSVPVVLDHADGVIIETLVGTKWIKGERKDQKGRKRAERKKRRKTCLLVEVGVDVVV